jgi:crotonobetainyl-CoA:carnitine CoA-transferase CaiB-like acyl-CoA transferase
MLSLEKYTVLDLSRFLPGPFASHVLADLGMNVVKIEEIRPRYGMGRDGLTPPDPTPVEEVRSAAYNGLARNKRSVALDLLDPTLRPESQEVFYRLAADADVVIEGYRPAATRWMGVDYETVRRHNPHIVYCSLTGFGQDGPYAQRPAHGGQFEAISGVLATGSRRRPERYPVPLGDVSGALYSAIAIVSALLHRELTGEGRYIDVSLAASAMSLMVMGAAESQRPFEVRPAAPPIGRALAFLQCRDGKWISTGNSESTFWTNFCRVLGHPEWVRLQHDEGDAVDQMIADVRALFSTKDRDEWLTVLTEAETCVAPVNDIADALTDVQMQHLGMVLRMDHPHEGPIAQLGLPFRVSDERPLTPAFAPLLGEHTRVVLEKAGYSSEEIDDLERRGIVFSRPPHDELVP